MTNKRKTMSYDTAEVQTETRKSPRRKVQKIEPSHAGPLLALPWDCASLIFDYLDMSDLAHCEQVCQGWRTFVNRWMVARGYYLHLPERWRPDLETAQTLDQQVATVKQSLLDHAKYSKIATGRASSARVIEKATCLEVSGDYAAWVVRNKVFGQRLGFQADGSLYPNQSWGFRGRCCSDDALCVSPGGYVIIRMRDSTGLLDCIVSVQTGKKLWRRRCPPDQPSTHWATILGAGATRLYSLTMENGSEDEAYLEIHELATGALIHRTHIGDYSEARLPRRRFYVRRVGDREVLVSFSTLAKRRMSDLPSRAALGPRRPNGFDVINPEDGSILQSFRGPFCQDNDRPTYKPYEDSYIVPSTENDGEFVVICRHKTSTAWVFKVERFSPDAAGTFQRMQTDILEMRRHRDGDRDWEDRLGPELEPFRNLCLHVMGAFNVPHITTMEECAEFDVGGNREVYSHRDSKVDRWFRDCTREPITVPAETKRDMERQQFSIGEPWEQRQTHRLRAVGVNKMVVEPDGIELGDRGHVHALCDFDFRHCSEH